MFTYLLVLFIFGKNCDLLYNVRGVSQTMNCHDYCLCLCTFLRSSIHMFVSGYLMWYCGKYCQIFMVDLCTFSKLFICSLHSVYICIVIVALYNVGSCVFVCELCTMWQPYSVEKSAMHCWYQYGCSVFYCNCQLLLSCSVITNIMLILQTALLHS